MIMKKLMLVLLLGGFLFTSCQKDDLSSQTELEAVKPVKARIKKKEKERIRRNDLCHFQHGR